MQSALESPMRIARSEAEAAGRLATAMRDQGNSRAIAQAFEAGLIVSLGADRFVNRALCTASAIRGEAIDAVIEFFETRNLSPSIQLPGWIDSTTSVELRERGFRPDWTRSLLAATPDEAMTSAAANDRSVLDVAVFEVTDELLDAWLHVLAQGNETPPSMRPISDEYARAAHLVPRSIDLLADLGAGPVACGSVQLIDGVAWLGGAATLPSARCQGLQAALLAHRVVRAGHLGAQFVAATAVPDSVSERNLVRAGLVRVDTQTVWTFSRRA